jgi:hypothetical protein
MIEKVIPLNQLLGFIVLDEHDAEVINNEFRDKKRYRLDIYTMSNLDYNLRPFPIEQICEEFRDIGMQGFLIDQLKCPEVVKAFMCTIANLQSVLWARFPTSSIGFVFICFLLFLYFKIALLYTVHIFFIQLHYIFWFNVIFFRLTIILYCSLV